MGTIVLASKNALDTGATLYGDADVAFPLTNLQDPIYAKVWRYTPGTNADGNVARFAMSMGLVRTNHLALCAHNMGEHGQIRLRTGTARFDSDFLTDRPFTHDMTFGGGANGTRTNEYGTLVAATCPRYEHDRRFYDNGFVSSEDLTSATWVEQAGAKKLDASTVDFAQAGAKVLQQLLQFYSDSYEQKWQVRLLSGDGTFCFQLNNGTVDVDGPTQVATTDWQWLRSDLVTGAATSAGTAGVKKLVAPGMLQLRKAQIRRGVFPVSHQDRDRYRKTTTQRRFQRIGAVTEAGATNSLLQSHVYTNAAWTKTAAVTAGAGIAPDGTNTISSINATAISQAVFQDLALGGTTARAVSHIFKAGGTATSVDLAIAWLTGGTTQTVTCRFNPSTGAFINSFSTGATLRAAAVKDLGGGYFRAYVEGVGTNAANTVVRTQLVWNTTGTLLAWGTQNEANFVTTYIPTTTAALTRTVDTAVVEPGTWVPYVWNAAEGTVYHEAMVDEVQSGQVLEGSRVSATGGANIISMPFFDNGNLVGFQATIFDTGVFTAQIAPTPALARGAVQRGAIRYRANDFSAALNGVSVGTDTSCAIPAITAVNLMAGAGVTSYVRRVTIWPTGKSDADLLALTTVGPSAIDFDSGWKDVLQMPIQGDVPATWGKDYDILKTFPMRAVEWMRVELYDPAKTSSATTFDIGRAWVGKFLLAPAKGASYGMEYAWRERTTSDEAQDGRKFFNERPRIRTLVFTLPRLTPAEAARLHEMQGSGGTSQEVLVLTDPDDEADCQRYGFVGYLSKLDPIKYPLVNVREAAFELEKKR